MQIELSCQLLQAKLFSRGSAQNTAPLLGVSIGLSVCCSVALGSDLRLRQLAFNFTNPSLTFNDGLLDYLRGYPTPRTPKIASDLPSALDSVNILKTNLKLDVGNLVMRFTANIDSAVVRTVSATLKSVSMTADSNERFAVILAGIRINDNLYDTQFSCTDFVANLDKSPDSSQNLFINVRIFNPYFVLHENDIVLWTEYYHEVERRISSHGQFEDDFSTASIAGQYGGVNGDGRLSSYKSLSVEVNTFHCRLVLSDGQEIDTDLELGTVGIDEASPLIFIEQSTSNLF
ncbi:unnamed protein product [Gongylonema pulchrum]|uniref:Lectin_legB domain-containing protein n=1 Tax=Gongylonema pulchrum TaxID=637853 RepID=A0A183DSC4_9BILA|nr:unnamed protein product [Gongylonema pulchrum]